MQLKYRKSFACYLLIGFHIFLGIGALFGGGAFILAPDGSLLKIPLTILQFGPFNSFLIPGLILFISLGVLPLLTAIFLISEKQFTGAERFSFDKTMHWSWNSSLYIGFILLIWIMVEIYIIQGIAFIHVFYAFLGLAIQAVTLLPSVKAHYSIIYVEYNEIKSDIQND